MSTYSKSKNFTIHCDIINCLNDVIAQSYRFYFIYLCFFKLENFKEQLMSYKIAFYLYNFLNLWWVR